ncbi:transmembrane protein 17B-like isoform X2 [Neodiprion virginianus]|uniref:transmembrane protein 17B-like isoform X2 n=1 Tax=Neodiprion fabricii TaxID=2872261 RepID=UPI001ED8CD2B|nr:transmembrane protein 17B-like isoform X2 [Neodiprion fabricii]XP_046615576.1 transmembrane protein 17B-like isoform X2 [Neodiprion virginianus]
MWKDTVISASDRIFPGLAYHNRIKEFHDIGNKPCDLFDDVGMVSVVDYHKLSDIYKFITVGVFVIVAVSECIRLYLGYLGNLAEKIPELACFWLISTLIQFPLQMFTLVDGRMLPGRGEHVVNSVMLVFLLTEIITGTIALRNSANHHAKRFYLAQLYEIDEKLE